MVKSLTILLFTSLPYLLLAQGGFLEKGYKGRIWPARGVVAPEPNTAVLPYVPSTAMLPDRPVNTINDRAGEVREALRHLWSGYKQKTWGADEIRPISGTPGESWGGVGMLILDSLDTLWLAGLQDEFSEGRDWVAKLELNPQPTSMRASFCEMTWRGLAGLLSAYALSGHHVFLDKAQLLGERLLQGFYSPAQGFQIPATYIDVHNTDDVKVDDTRVLASIGAHVIEFNALSEATGEPRYKQAADSVMNALMRASDTVREPLATTFFNVNTVRYDGDIVTVSANADAYFEYMLKWYLQGGCKDYHLLTTFKDAMEEMREALIRTSPQGYTYIATSARRLPQGGFGGKTEAMQHLACFWGGQLALAAHYVPANEVQDWWLPTGIEITRTCYEAYKQTPSGLAPEVFSFGQDGLNARDPAYKLRPETLESLFFLHRITGNSTYRDWAWDISSNILKLTKTTYGFASIRDVMQPPRDIQHLDSEETFMGAETLKYSLLTQLPAEEISLDYFVFNTEAHPLPILEYSCKRK